MAVIDNRKTDIEGAGEASDRRDASAVAHESVERELEQLVDVGLRR